VVVVLKENAVFGDSRSKRARREEQAMPELTRAEWAEKMSRLARDCAGSCAIAARKHLRTLWQLLEVVPQPVLLEGMRRVSSSRMQALLAEGRFESAAMELTGGASCTTSVGPRGHRASVTLPGDAHPETCAADTFTLSIVGALANALAARAQEPLAHVLASPS
jgi:hypothetical protein